MNILMIVIKNTACLDFAIPLLWKIKQVNPQANVSVLYCTLSRKEILRESRFYTVVFTQCGVPQYDFADFLQLPFTRLQELFRGLFSKSNRDASRWDQRLRKFPVGGRIATLRQHSFDQIENLLGRMVSAQQILPSFNPDIVLFDNTFTTRFFGREHFYAYLGSARKKVVLLPHAPHHGYLTAFTPFDDVGEKLPDYCEFWMPFKFDRSWEKLPEKRSQFAYVGYPGLDSEWLDQFKWGTQPYLSGEPKSSRSGNALTCLFIIRRFLPKEQARSPSPDAYIYSYDEFSYYLNLVETALNNAGVAIELIVKPHPSSDFETLRHVFAESRIAKWRISYDPVYAHLPECDFAISLYSTVPLITAMAGIPTVLLHSSTQTMVHQEDLMKQLYTGLRFYIDNPEDLPLRLKEVIEIASERKRTSGPAWKGDIDHLRHFYPDGAMQRCLERLGV